MALPSESNRKKALLAALSDHERNGHPALEILATELPLEHETSIDALALDPLGRLVLLFLGPKDPAAWVSGILDAFAWTEEHREPLRARFDLGERDRGLPPRALLVAPEFPSHLIRRLGALRGLDLLLLESVTLQIGGERKISFRQQPLPQEKLEGGGFPDWALDPGVASLFREALGKLKKIDAEIRIAWGPGYAEMIHQGSTLGILRPDPNGLRILVPGQPVQDFLAAEREDLRRGLDAIFRRYVETSLDFAADASESAPETSELASAARQHAALSEEELAALTK